MPYKNPQKQKEAKRQWYLRNKKLTIERSMAYKHDNQKWFKSEKLKDVIRGCVDSVVLVICQLLQSSIIIISTLKQKY